LLASERDAYCIQLAPGQSQAVYMAPTSLNIQTQFERRIIHLLKQPAEDGHFPDSELPVRSRESCSHAVGRRSLEVEDGEGSTGPVSKDVGGVEGRDELNAHSYSFK